MGGRECDLAGNNAAIRSWLGTHTCSQDGPAVALWFPWKFTSEPLAQDKELTSPVKKVEQGR